METLTYVGENHRDGAVYSIINRNLALGFEENGIKVSRNFHTYQDEITDVAFAHEYPPRPLNLKHKLNVCATAWEFATPAGFPIMKRKSINTYDILVVPSKWVENQIRDSLSIPVKTAFWSIDWKDIKRYSRPLKLDIPDGKIKLLWLGGTDRRHGFDVAVEVIKRLPENYHLIAKQSVHYPEDAVKHPRITTIRENMKSVIPLYRGCDIFLQTARGIGFSLPTLEALGCGMTVVSTPLPPIMEFEHTQGLYFSEGGKWVEMEHHLYDDCNPVWLEPDIDSLVSTVLSVEPQQYIPSQPFQDKYNWKNVAKTIMEIIN